MRKKEESKLRFATGMSMNIVGNVNGSYQTPRIDLFELAKKQEKSQPVVANASTIMEHDSGIKVNISQDGLKALHGSKMSGSIDLNKQLQEIKYISEHQPIESFGNRLQRTLQESYAGVSYEDRPSVEKKGETVLNTLKEMADEIVSGYTSGDRVRFAEDRTSVDGFRKLTMEDELAVLKDEFDVFVENRFGKRHQEESIKVANAINEIQAVKEEFGIDDEKVYELEQIPDNFVEDLIMAGRQYIANLLK